MNSGRIFLVGSGPDDLVPMAETPYATEVVLQDLLARYPSLLPGDQISPEAPRRWLLVARELSVPGEEGGSGIWSLDHLFLDQDGVPTFVECKRATDTRIRREVVAQMLDYAANGTAYWPSNRLRQAAEETAKAEGTTVDDKVRALIGTDDADIEAFWSAVEENLRTGHIRLVFLADRTPRELRRLVEFLNAKMADVEVLAVEVKQYLGDQHRVVVPRVVGLTEAARDTKRPGARTMTNRVDMLAKCAPAAVEVFAFMLDEAARRGHSVVWGTSGFSVGFVPTGQSRVAYAFAYPPDDFQFYTEYLEKRGLLVEDTTSAIRRDLTADGTLQAAGRYTLRAQVTSDRLDALKSRFIDIAKRMDALAAGVNPA